MSTGDLFEFFEDQRKPEAPPAPDGEGEGDEVAPPASRRATATGSGGGGGGGSGGGAAAQVFTVTQLTRRIRNLLELKIGSVLLEGEVSNLRRQSSGHVYFTLKDSGAQISCVLFRSDAARAKVELADGLGIQARGEISVYEPRGNYQIIVRGVRVAGQGELQMRFEALKRKLHGAGLFDPDAKRAIPAVPRTVCLVTSPTGAAVRDMLNILARRAPWVRILIYPVRVQGDMAAGEIARALRHLTSGVPGLPEIDTIVLARGGGSLEDLWPFNEEVVAHAIHACTLPVVSAVGHEIDFTIADFAADLRAPTPSAAAELVVPDGFELRARVDGLRSALHASAERALRRLQREVDHVAEGALQREPRRALDDYAQRLDHIEASLGTLAQARLGEHERHLRDAQHALRLAHPGAKLDRQQRELERAAERLGAALERALLGRRSTVERAAAALKNLGPQSVFARGFTATTDRAGNLITSPSEAPAGTRLTTHFATGSVDSTVD